MSKQPVSRTAPQGRALKAAASRQPEELHRIVLTECEFLHAYFSLEQDRIRTRKSIRKGLMMPQDLEATDSLWVKLEAVMVARLMGGHS